MGSPSLWAGEDASSRRVVAQSRIVQPPARAGGGPEPGGTAGTEQAVCSATWAEPGVDGNHFQHPAGDHDPYGILRLQAHSASVTVRNQVLPQVFGKE